jgi:ParB family chromosome partitioning protein
MIEQIEAKAMAGGIPVYCAHDKILETDRLVENPKNPNKHPKAQIESLAKIIKYQGWRHPIVISTRSGFVVKGHGRLMAARELKTAYVPVDYQNYESEASEYADLIADNKIQEFSELDMQMSADILKDIKDSGDIELEMSGFTEDALNELFSKLNEGEIKEDECDIPVPENPVSKQGDIWLLGRHRLICGDSTKSETYIALMDGKKANLVVTDPPYNVAYEGSAGTIKNDNMDDKKFYEFLLSAYKGMYENLADGGSIYVFHADRETINFRTAFREAGFFCHQTCIWIKNTPVLGRCDYQYNHEPVLVGWKPTAGHKFYGDRKQRTTWNFDRPSKSKYHPTMKPITLVAYPIMNSSLTNSIVLDPFGGSGSTLIACEQTERICHSIELDEKYVDVIVKRFIEQQGSAVNVFLLRDGIKTPYSEVVAANE